MKWRTEGSQDESGPRPIVIAKIPLGDHVSDIVASPHDSIAYVALSDSIAVIGSDLEFSCVIPIGGNPRDLTIDADGSRLYATNYGGSVSVIDIAGVDVIPGVCRARRVDTQDGPLIYAAANALDGRRISVIGAGGATDTIDVGGHPEALAVSARWPPPLRRRPLVRYRHRVLGPALISVFAVGAVKQSRTRGRARDRI